MELFNTSDVKATLGFPVTGDFITDTLGIKPHSTDKRAMFWSAAQMHQIVEGLRDHFAFLVDNLELVHTEKAPPKPGKAPAAAPAASAAAAAFDDEDEL
jgi:hypothetical protein